MGACAQTGGGHGAPGPLRSACHQARVPQTHLGGHGKAGAGGSRAPLIILPRPARLLNPRLCRFCAQSCGCSPEPSTGAGALGRAGQAPWAGLDGWGAFNPISRADLSPTGPQAGPSRQLSSPKVGASSEPTAMLRPGGQEMEPSPTGAEQPGEGLLVMYFCLMDIHYFYLPPYPQLCK